MNKKFLIAIYSLSFALFFILLGIFIYSKTQTKISKLNFNGENLIALNKNAVKSECKNPLKKPYIFFAFTEVQKVHFKNLILTQGTALNFTLQLKSQNQESFADKNQNQKILSLGFLYADDFEGKNKLKKSLKNRPLIVADFSQTDENKINLIFNISKNSQVPQGFFIHGTFPYELLGVQETKQVLGFSKKSDKKNASFAFGENGGTVDFSFKTFDFSCGEKIFLGEESSFDKTEKSGKQNYSVEENQNLTQKSVQKSAQKKFFPVIRFSMLKVSDIGSSKNQLRIQAKYGDENLNIRRTKNSNEFYLQTAAYKNPCATLEILSNENLIQEVFMFANENQNLTENSNFEPIKTDLGLVVDWNQNNWRCSDYEIFEWEGFEKVLIFDFANYQIQNEFLTRMAYFVEKAGYKGTFVSDDFVRTKHGYNAHDYKAKDLAEFFTQAELQNFNLNQSEILLREILLYNGLIVENNSNTFSEGKGAIISISRESPEYLRWRLLAHEAWHGIYFTDENFRNAVAALYNLFDEESLEFIKIYWKTQPGLEYDINDEYLMQNEFMAYIMQNSSPKNYFLELANRPSVNRIEGDLASYIRSTQAQAFEEAGNFLNDYAFDNWGLACGRVSLITK